LRVSLLQSMVSWIHKGYYSRPAKTVPALFRVSQRVN
jgi:hypothetical protein